MPQRRRTFVVYGCNRKPNYEIKRTPDDTLCENQILRRAPLISALGPKGVVPYLQNITPERWPKVYIWPVLVLQIPDERLVNAGLLLSNGVEPGLGSVLSCGAKLESGRVCAFHRHVLSPRPLDWVLEVENVEGVVDDVNRILATLDVDESEITWVSSEFVFDQFEVIRQDDNGICFNVGKFRFQATAQRSAGLFEATGHKQMYWVQPVKMGPNYEIKRTPEVTLRSNHH